MLIDNIIGIVGQVYRGNYDSSVKYDYLNVVTYAGSSYTCINEEGCTNIIPTNEEYWQLSAEKGDTGDIGPKGEPGEQGETGYTPQKGVDYFTSADKEEIKDEVINEITPTLNQNLKDAKDYTDNAISKDFKDITYNETTATFTFTRHDNTTFTVDLPIEQTVKDGRYDEETEELVLVLVSGQEIRIPVSGLIDDYTGVDSATIQVSISADNKITCNIIAGTIAKTLLTTELQTEIDNKVNKEAFVYDEATETLSITI